MNVYPSFKEFVSLYNDYSHIPLFYELSGDFDTPVSLYAKIRMYSPYSFLLESALQSGSSGRYSFIGFSPKRVISIRNRIISIIENGSVHSLSGDPIEFLRSIMAEYSLPHHKDIPPFIGGLVGYFSYDAIRLFETVPDSNPDTLSVDDILLMLVENLIIYDHYRHTITLSMLIKRSGNCAEDYQQGLETIQELVQTVKEKTPGDFADFSSEKGEKFYITSNIKQSDFENNVKRAKEYIAKGDIFQIVLSQRFSVSIDGDGFDFYRCLRRINPSPYMFYFNLNDVIITGSSPEVLVKCKDGIVTTRPLAGTRHRGESPDDDRKIAAELLHNEKERSEHIMLVDLGRNDLGRICRYGSIQVPEFMEIERYSSVMHIVSEVTGQLADGKDCFDVLKGAFPAGTVTGAPKIRAMEIIDKLEPVRRGIYAGAVGYFDFHNNVDTCISIRTMVIKNGTAYIQTGAGIVADSDPKMEYRETIHKSHSLIQALALSEGKTYDISD